MMTIYSLFIAKPLLKLPVPKNISAMWSFGSMLSLTLIMQIISGILVSLHFLNSSSQAFNSVIRLEFEVKSGWMVRSLHANGASLFFLLIFFHIARGLYYNSKTLMTVWLSGISILLLLMATAFMGYVLPWGQMSYWAATVIINLISAVPFIGNELVQWVWGDYAVSASTLTRLFSFHFLVPFIICALALLHIIFLHSSTSKNPILSNSFNFKIPFHPLLSIKDLLYIIIFFPALFIFSLSLSSELLDSENFIKMNPLKTPDHIKPEWYFLFAYAILRSVPNKLGGVILMLLSILLLGLMVMFCFKASRGIPSKKFTFWLFSSNFIMLTWLGGQIAEEPYTQMALNLSLLFFLLTSLI